MIPAAPLHRLVLRMIGEDPSVAGIAELADRFDLDLEDLSTLARVAAGEAPYATRDPKAERSR